MTMLLLSSTMKKTYCFVRKACINHEDQIIFDNFPTKNHHSDINDDTDEEIK